MSIIVHDLILIIAIIFLVLGEGYTFGIIRTFGAQDKKFSINFTKAKTNFCLGLHYSDDNNYLCVNAKRNL